MGPIIILLGVSFLIIIWIVASKTGGSSEMDQLATETTREIIELTKKFSDSQELYIEASSLIMSSFYMQFGKAGIRQLAKYAAMIRGKLIANGVPRSTADAIQQQFKATVDFQLSQGRRW